MSCGSWYQSLGGSCDDDFVVALEQRYLLRRLINSLYRHGRKVGTSLKQRRQAAALQSGCRRGRAPRHLSLGPIIETESVSITKTPTQREARQGTT
jgi:hypothetical protein